MNRMQRTRAQRARAGQVLTRLWRKVLNRRRPRAGHVVTVWVGSPTKRTGDWT